ncbi:uncharacterized protein EDB93DRAFT_1121063 [Suillus bovinus]|uniref:uncharacterized protein n=1 Tax=Suillus bovinus TaxID=48563 RepID=UPI001B8660A2|nr:uncharacterized protein EDB93DRAFT_1121063 [Suillus bovinus]KAG2158361.1 hypothetical protein EDB93DRAFT_1121063 [Suillus bovinus]
MAPDTLWNTFRKFRRVVLALASIISLTWSIIIIVYMANNWSSYNSGERGFLFALIVLDFVSSILLYLMIVVKYQFWPDAARTMVLLGIDVAAAVVFMILSPKFPCNAFGSTAKCHNMTMTVVIGLWVISALILLYAIWLPFVHFIPRTPSATQADDSENQLGVSEVTDDLRMSHASSASQAFLFKNQEGMSPEFPPSELPYPPQQTTGDDHIEMEMPNATVGYSHVSPRSSIARTIRAPGIPNRSASGSSSPQQYPSPPEPLLSSTLPNPFVGETLDANRDSVASSLYGSTCEFPTVSIPIAEAPRRTLSAITGRSVSVYSQRTIPSRLGTTSPATTRQTSLLTSPSISRSPVTLSVHSMMASVHDHAEHQTAGGSNELTYELHLSDVPTRYSRDELSDFPRDIVQDPVQHPTLVRPSLQHVRTDSTNSNIDPDEWRRLVLSAAGREL